jgi:hypothetical protein
VDAFDTYDVGDDLDSDLLDSEFRDICMAYVKGCDVRRCCDKLPIEIPDETKFKYSVTKKREIYLLNILKFYFSKKGKEDEKSIFNWVFFIFMCRLWEHGKRSRRQHRSIITGNVGFCI